MKPTDTDVSSALRRWSAGNLAVEAATELIIRSGLTTTDRPWVSAAPVTHIDFEAAVSGSAGLASGEQHLLRVAASIAGVTTIRLDQELAGIGRERLDLVLAALAHAGGYGQTAEDLVVADTTVRRVNLPALHRWPGVVAKPGAPRLRPRDFPAVMTAVGVTQSDLARMLDVDVSLIGALTVKGPLTETVRQKLETVEAIAAWMVRRSVTAIKRCDNPVMTTYRTDAAYWAANPEAHPYPASFHRAVTARVASEVPGLRVDYAEAHSA